MPTVLRIDGWRIVIYPNDHPPAHVHVIGPGWMVVVDLIAMEARKIVEADKHVVCKVLDRLEDCRSMLLNEWRRFHG